VIAAIPLAHQEHSAPSNKTKLRRANAEFPEVFEGEMGNQNGQVELARAQVGGGHLSRLASYATTRASK